MKIISTIIFAFLVLGLVYVAVVGADSANLWTTDAYGNNKIDFPPGEHVYIHGAGFNSNSVISIDITRPDGVVESCNTDSCHIRYVDGLQTSDGDGAFVYDYDLNGITGEYLVYVSDGVNSAQIIFTDAAIFNIKIIQPANLSLVLGSVRVRGKWNVTDNPPGLLTQYNVQIVWGDGTVNNTVNINRSSNGTGSNEKFFGEFDTQNMTDCVGGNDNCNISNFNHTYENCGPFNLTAKLYHGNPPGQEAGDASATVTINPGITEDCDNQEDDDCDTFVDCADSDCNSDPDCQVCGNGIVETGEQCDDGNANSGDGCSSQCVTEFCGDGIIQFGLGEQCEFDIDCDDQNPFTTDTCVSCQCSNIDPVVCGDGNVDAGEQCDDGNANSGDGCSSQCVTEFCGDGIIQFGLGEQCEFNSDCDDFNPFTTDTCSQCICSNIDPVVCGDGNVDPGEQCDDGNTNNGDGCGNLCQIESFCGDGSVDPGEQCDGTNLSGQTCQSLGYVPGILTCDAGCNFDVNGCNTTVEPIKDAKVAKAQPTSNFGKGRIMSAVDKTTGTDRSYIGFDLSNKGLTSVTNGTLQLYVYNTGSQIIGSKIEAWYCANTDFNELTITWNNQPSGWNKNGSLLTPNCINADNYTVVNKVVAGLPETTHVWNLTSEINNALATDNKFTIVIKHDREDFSNNNHHVQYLTKEYPELAFRPKLILS